MLKNSDLKKRNKIALIVVMIIIGFGFIINLIDVIRIQNVANVAMLVYYAFIIYYAVYGYKIPHGNLLKIVVLSFSFVLYAKFVNLRTPIIINNIFMGIAIIMIAFMSGRLDRLRQNNIIAVVVLACLLLPNILFYVDSKTRTPVEELPIVESMPVQEIQPEPTDESNALVTFIMGFTSYSSALVWAAIVGAYNVRYLTHKEAGLTDK